MGLIAIANVVHIYNISCITRFGSVIIGFIVLYSVEYICKQVLRL